MLKILKDKNIFKLSDRRVAPRYHQNLEGSIIYSEPFSTVIQKEPVTLYNISEHGFSGNSRKPLKLPPVFQLELDLPTINYSISCSCKTVWEKKTDQGSVQYGFQIEDIDPISENFFREFLSQNIHDKKELNDRRIQSEIETQFDEFKNSNNEIIRYAIDRSISDKSLKDYWIVMPPDLGETKRSYLLASYYLAANGFSIFRFDATNHVGESQGTINNFVFDSLSKDTADCLDFIKKEFSPKKIFVLSRGFASLTSLKALTESSYDFLGCLSPIFDLQERFNKNYLEDFIKNHINSEDVQTSDIFGFPIKTRSFLDDILENSYLDYQKDLEHALTNDMNLSIYVSQSKWDQVSEKLSFLDFNQPKTNLHIVPDLKRSLENNSFETIDQLMEKIIHDLHHVILQDEKKELQNDIKQVNYREIAVEMQFEKEKARNKTFFELRESEPEFWGKYLEKFHFAIRIPEYRAYFERVTSLLGEFQHHDRIFDAGCGNGSFGAWLMHFFSSTNQMPLIQYTGGDFVPQALQVAKDTHETIQQSILEKIKVSPQFNYLTVNLDKKLPFMDSYFDKVSCNLVLTYLSHPQTTLKELLRVLKPGSNLVLTTVVPNPDFSIVYRNFLSICETDQERLAVKRLLNNTSDLLEKERNGQFRFFTEKELENMVTNLKIKDYTIEKALLDQIHILHIKKT